MNKKFEYYFNTATERASRYGYIIDEDKHMAIVTVTTYPHRICPVCIIYRHDFYEYDDGGTGLHDTYIDEISQNDTKAIEDAFTKACEGYVKCNYCDEWLKFDEAKRYAPAGCSCDKPECVEQAEADQDDFYDSLRFD